METKICSKCKEKKPVNEFYKRAKIKICSECKTCTCARTGQHSKNNPEKVKALKAEWRKNNIDRVRAQQTAWEKANPEKMKEKLKRRKEKIRSSPELIEKGKLQYKKWAESNKEKNKNRKAKWNKENSERVKSKAIEWRKNNLKRINKLRKDWLEKNPIQKINYAFGARIREAINGQTVNYRWKNEVGYGLKELKKHLQNQFKDGMSWENYGEWEVDHILPVSKFNFKSTKDEDFKRCWALKNLQPLWKADNIKKGNKLKKPLQQSLIFGY